MPEAIDTGTARLGGAKRRGILAPTPTAMAAALVAGSLWAPPAAAAASPPAGHALVAQVARSVIAGREQTWEEGVIRRVVDGDTVVVDVLAAAAPGLIAPPATPGTIAGQSFCSDRAAPGGGMPADGRLDACRVRLIGIQAPESAGAAASNTRARVEQCGATAAKRTLAEQLPPGTPVQLRSIAPTSVERNYSGGRLARAVYYRDSSGMWVDAAREVLRRGQALWFPFSPRDGEKPEPQHNLEYRRLVDAAALARQGIFWPNTCGMSRANQLRVWAVWDPAGSDANREHVVLLNQAPTPLDVSGWVVRDSSPTYATLPAGTVIPPGDFVRIWSGKGPAGHPTARDFRFNGGAQMFGNPADSASFHGDGVYVFDPQSGTATGNLRAWFHYPCDPRACTDPLTGRLRLGPVQYDPEGRDRPGEEFVMVHNAGGALLRLGGYALARRDMQFPFAPTVTLAPRASLKVVMGTGVDTPGVLHLGLARSLLSNRGDRITLLNLDGRPVDCRGWGTMNCKGLPTTAGLVRPSQRPDAPAAPALRTTGRRVLVSWAAPTPNGSPAITGFRARISKKVGSSWRSRGSCSVAAPRVTCTTRTLGKGRYRIAVKARNGKGYGPLSPSAAIRIR